MRSAKGRHFRAAALAAAVTAVAACGGSPAGPSGPATPPTPSYAGSWSGQTDGQDPLTFTISGNQVTDLRLEYSAIYLVPVSRGAVVAVLCDIEFRPSGPVSFTGNRFEVPVQSSVGATVVRGAFESETGALGSVDAFNLTRGCGNDTNIIGADQDGAQWRAARG